MSQNKVTLNKILLIIIFSLIVFIAAGTVMGLILKKGEAGSVSSNSSKTYITVTEPSQKEITSLNKHSEEKIASYTGIGRIRILTKADENDGKGSGDGNTGDTGTPLVIEPWFTYEESNYELYEELSKKRILISGLISNYFSSKTKMELFSSSEDKIKADLLKEINSQLVLGKIIQIYFTDFIFLE